MSFMNVALKSVVPGSPVFAGPLAPLAPLESVSATGTNSSQRVASARSYAMWLSSVAKAPNTSSASDDSDSATDGIHRAFHFTQMTAQKLSRDGDYYEALHRAVAERSFVLKCQTT